MRIDAHRLGHEAFVDGAAGDRDPVARAFLAEDLALRSIDEHGLIEQTARVSAVRLHGGGGVIKNPRIPHRLGEEARIEQVHHGVLGAAGIDVDRQPVGRFLRIEGSFGVGGGEVAVLIPRRAHEGVHGVGFSRRRVTFDVRGGEERRIRRQGAAPGGELHVLRQEHRKAVVGHRLETPVGAIDHRDRATPVALPGDQPITHPIVDRLGAQVVLLEPVDGGGDRRVGSPLGVGRRDAVDRAAVDHHPRADIGLGHRGAVEATATFGLDDGDHGQVEFAGELEIALIVGRHRHDRSRAVREQHVVGDPHRDALLIHRVDGVSTGEDAGLLPFGLHPLELGAPGCLVTVRVDRRLGDRPTSVTRPGGARERAP